MKSGGRPETPEEMMRWAPLVLLAQEGGGAAPGPGGGAFSMLPMLVAIGFLFYFIVLRPQRREQGERESMLKTLKKNDRVITVGGIYGTVTNVRADVDEITIRVDESTNTKLRITLGSIARVVAAPGDEGAPASEAK